MANGQALAVHSVCHTKPYKTELQFLMKVRDTLVYDSDNWSTY